MKKVYFLVAVGLIGGLALVVWIIRALGPTPE
jgi:nitrate reductase NapE component